MTLLIAILSLLGACAGLAVLSRKGSENMILLYGFIGAIGLLAGWIVLLLCSSSGGISDRDKERLAASPYYVIGQFLGERANDQQVALLVSREEFESPHRENAIAALRAGLDGNATIEAIPIDAARADKVVLNDDESLPALKFLIRADDYNQKFTAYKNAKIVIVATPLPQDSRNMMLWKLSGKSEIYILNTPARLDLALNSRYINGYTTYNPEAQYESGVPRSLARAFDSRYLFVHR